MSLRLCVAFACVVVTATATACPTQTPTCEVFVACQRAVDPSVDTEAYEDTGACWSLPDGARDCDAQCRVALDALRQTPSPPAACTVTQDENP